MSIGSNGLLIRTDVRPGDIGMIVYLHGVLYAREYGWDATFEGYVAASFGEFILSADRSRSRLWVLEKDGAVAGSIGIVGRNNSNEAQLRWFFLVPELRGQGYGHRLMQAALDFCVEQNYQSVYLWTTSDLKAAAHLYESFGFQPTEEKTHPLWGKMITEVRYDLRL